MYLHSLTAYFVDTAFLLAETAQTEAFVWPMISLSLYDRPFDWPVGLLFPLVWIEDWASHSHFQLVSNQNNIKLVVFCFGTIG
jgi:hypothetical protein